MCDDLIIIKIACFRHFIFQTAFSTTCANFCKCACMQPAPYLVERILLRSEKLFAPFVNIRTYFTNSLRICRSITYLRYTLISLIASSWCFWQFCLAVSRLWIHTSYQETNDLVSENFKMWFLCVLSFLNILYHWIMLFKICHRTSIK